MASILSLIVVVSVTKCWAEYSGANYYDYGGLRSYYDYLLRQGRVTGKRVTKATTSIVRDLRHSYFQTLESYEVQATPASEKRYPWIAKVVHSKSKDYPYVCTAVCVEERLFITAGRCVISLKLAVTTVIYQNTRFPVKVFVLPSKPSKQMYEDIGIIVVEPAGYTGAWPSVALFSKTRTDDQYQWFADLKLEKLQYQQKAIGYATKKYLHRLKTPNMQFNLVEVDVVIDIEMCSKIMSKGLMEAFFVPCYHTCNWTEFKRNSESCHKYLGTEGAAVIDAKTSRLLGLATWGTTTHVYELPVGFAVPNSDNFFKDLECARKIKKDANQKPYKGYYQQICPK